MCLFCVRANNKVNEGRKSMFCKKCGLKILKGDRYCRECGARAEYRFLPDDKKTINTMWLTWITVIVAAVCLLIIGAQLQKYNSWNMAWSYVVQIINTIGGNL